MMPGKPLDPEGRMGVFKHLADVPDKYLLDNEAPRFEGRDVWAEWTGSEVTGQRSDKYQEQAERAGRYWKQFTGRRDRHHALAHPEDVNDWMALLLEDRQIITVYKAYWTKLEQFYTWLQYHADYPHRYHPVLMAAAEYPVAGELWDYKITQYHGEDNE